MYSNLVVPPRQPRSAAAAARRVIACSASTASTVISPSLLQEKVAQTLNDKIQTEALAFGAGRQRQALHRLLNGISQVKIQVPGNQVLHQAKGSPPLSERIFSAGWRHARREQASQRVQTVCQADEQPRAGTRRIIAGKARQIVLKIASATSAGSPEFKA
jgi:hypothetical protein